MPRTRPLAAAVLACSLGLLAPAGASPAAAATGIGLPVGGVFSAGTAWKLDVSGAPLHPNSPSMVANVAEQTGRHYGGVAAFNAYRYNTSVAVADANTPRLDVRWSNCQGWSWTPDGLTGPGGQFTAVPIPAGAVPAEGTDRQLTVWSPATDQLWEFWLAEMTTGGWSGWWGG